MLPLTRKDLDLNQLYFDHQVSLIRAQGATTGEVRRHHQNEASGIAGCIGQVQGKIGAAAAYAWMAIVRAQAA